MTTQFSFLRTLLLGLFVSVFGLAFAAGTPKNTPITNTASATYVSGGTPKTTFSNPVTTIVQQVYSLTITPDGTVTAPGQTKSALAGAPVYFNYILTNTGNGSDTFNLASLQTLPTGTTDDFDLSSVKIYRDVGCDGSVAGDPVVTSVTLNADASVCLILEGTLPSTATNNQNALINLTGNSVGSGNTNGSPNVTDTNNWAKAVVTTAGNLTATKTANPTSTVAAGGTVSYTIEGLNNGGSAAFGVDLTSYGLTGVGIIVTDELKPNQTFTAGSLSGSAGAGTVERIYSTNNGTSWSATLPTTGTINAVGIVIRNPASPASAFFTQGANYSMTFSVTVSGTAAATTPITNTAYVTYATGTAATTKKTTPTNMTSVTVNANAKVAVGPALKAADTNLSGNATYTDPATGKTWTVTLSGGYTTPLTTPPTPDTVTDTQTLTSTVYTGDTVAFRHTVLNNGNATSSYTLSTTNTNGYSVTLYAADGVTPLSGNLGPLAPGASQDVVVKVAVPVGAAAGTGTTVTLTATSTSSAASDITKDVIPTPTKGYSVDLATLGASGDGNAANDNPANRSTNPGVTLSYPVDVRNTGNQADSYNLTVPNLPAGWSAVFVQADCTTGDPNGPAATQTPQIAVGAKVCYVVQVTVPANAVPGANLLTFTTTSTTDPTSTDSVTTTVTVNTVSALTFVTNQTATTSPNGVVTYTHTLTNNGNATATVAIPAQTGKTFTYQYSLNGTDFFDSLSNVTVAAGASQTVYVRVIVPGSAADGAEETVTVTATATYPGGATASASVQDRTLVRSGELRLVKTVRTCSSATCSTTPTDTVLDPAGATAKPGDYLEYTVVATNIGSANLTNAKMSDPLPSYTTFASATATTTATGTVLYSTNGTTWTATAPTLNAGQSIYVGVDTNSPADTNITTADVLTPGQSITLKFVVRVQ